MDSSQGPDDYRRFWILLFLLKHYALCGFKWILFAEFQDSGLNQVSALFDPRLFNSLAGLAETFVGSSQS